MPLRPRAAALPPALLLAGLVACAQPAPVVQSRRHWPLGDALARVAVAPFRSPPAPAGAGAPTAEDAALLSRIVGEALASQGLAVVPVGDLARALPAGSGVPDPASAAWTAAREFGATSVVLGELLRFREREAEGSAARGASVAFRVALHDAPSAQRLWSARFDETQRPLSANVLDRPRYPGGGTRWLSASELARWGAESLAGELAGERAGDAAAP